MNYNQFLESKVVSSEKEGFTVHPEDLHPSTFPHQRDIIMWAAEGGKRAIFAAFGLGKTHIQLELGRLTVKKKGGKGLICCPLGVKQEFKKEAERLDIQVEYCTSLEQVKASPADIILTNYERVRDGNIEPSYFTFASLDEAAVLRSYGSKTYQEFLPKFRDVPFRYVCTATPSPNKYKELIHYAGFLGIMDTGQALAQPLDSKVLTPIGWKEMGDIEVGDDVISLDGKPTEVLGVYPQGEKDIYRVTFSDGSSTECTEEHLWETQTQYQRNAYAKYAKRNGKKGDRWEEYFTVKETCEIASTLNNHITGSKNHSIPLVGPVEFEKRDVDIDPYLMGLLLGDGYLRSSSVEITTVDQQIINEASDIVSRDYNLALVQHGKKIRKDGRKNISYSITNGNGSGFGNNQLLQATKGYGISGKRSHNKFIPDDYLFNSKGIRIELLRGLMDSDGTIDNENRTTSFLSTSKELAEGVQFLVQSFGGISTIYKDEPYKGDAEINGRKVRGRRKQYYVSVKMPNGINPFRLSRKADLVTDFTKYFPKRYITNVEKIGSKEAQCIAVDHERHLYVTDDFILTHNTRFFKRDSQKANHLTIHPHKEKEFWLWMSTWATFVTKPSDLGYSDEGYDLPDIEIIQHQIEVDEDAEVEKDGQVKAFRNPSKSLSAAAREKRISLKDRIKKAAEIVGDSPKDNFILWHHLEAERKEINRHLDVSSVYGSQSESAKEDRLIRFSNGEDRILSTKPQIAGSGCNFQDYCHKAIFCGIDYKFNDFIQAVHRIHRFGQNEQVEIHIIYTDSENEVYKTLMAKWERHKELVSQMTAIISEYGLTNKNQIEQMKRSIGIQRKEENGEYFTAVNNDCVEEMRQMDDNSIDLIHTSIPFGNHYEYTACYNDFGHNTGDDDFFDQMDYLIPEMLRVLKPGRVAAIHVKDRIMYGNVTGLGMTSVNPFSDMTTKAFIKNGFIFFGRITVVTDVVRENNQTYRLGWSEQCKDGTKMGVGMPEYVLLFRKLPTDQQNSYADTPVQKEKEEYTRGQWQIDAHGFWRSSGDRFITPEELNQVGIKQALRAYRHFSNVNIYDYREHMAMSREIEKEGKLPASFMLFAPQSHSDWVWSDVTRMRTLNCNQSMSRKENHVCPLQFDIVDRIINRYSNKDETVLDPFGGLMTVPYRAIKMNRKGYGIELNEEYWRHGLDYCRQAEYKRNIPTLFDAIETDPQVA